jgi:hypothetical protein
MRTPRHCGGHMTFNGSIWECQACGRWRFPEPDPWLLGREVAKLMGVSRKTLYRWIDEGRFPAGPWRESDIAPLVGKVVPRERKGPPRNPHAARYTTGRHRFDEVRKAS